MISIIVPTYGRAARIPGLAANIHDTTVTAHEVVFVVEGDDTGSIETAEALGGNVRCVLNAGSKTYAGAANTGYRETTGEYLFAAADDVQFHPGWDKPAVELMDDQVHVVGTQDLLNPYVAKGWHATHYLVARRYLDEEGGCVDAGPGSFLHEGYSHNYTDTEFIGTAKARARFRPCLDSVVEHLHHSAGKTPKDATTDKTMADYSGDTARYDARLHLWWGLSR